MEQLQEKLQEFSDEYLLKQYFNHKDEYKPEALEVLKTEMDRRNIDSTNLSSAMKSITTTETESYEQDSFEKFDHVFSSTDILLAVAILKENKAVFYVDNFLDTTIPVENQALKTFTIHVQSKSIELAHQLIDEHFEKSDGKYLLKITSPKERLKAFSFSDIHLTEMEDRELIEVTLSNEEKDAVVSYGKRLLDEVDKIEESGDRVVFYYDSIEELIDILNESATVSIARTQLLSILEILQIYCGDPAFPAFLDTTIDNILSFFIAR